MTTQVNASTETFGNTSVGDQTFQMTSHKGASKVQLSGLGVIQSVSVYFATVGFNAKAAVYEDSNDAPGALLSESVSTHVRLSGWTTFNVTQKTLNGGTYWLAYVADSSKAEGRINYSDSETKHGRWQGRVPFESEFTSWFGTLSAKDTGSVSVYATYEPFSAPLTPLVTIIPTPTPISTSTPAPDATPTPKPTVDATPNPTNTPKPTWTPAPPTTTPAPSAMVTLVPSSTPTSTPAPVPTPGSTSTLVPTVTPSPVPSSTIPPSETSTPSPSLLPPSTLAPAPTLTASTTPTPTVFPSSPSSVKLGTYSNSECTIALSSINWGQLTPGATTALTLYVRNEGTTAITLYKSVANWNPAGLSNYLTLYWNYNNQSINPSASLALTLSLTVADNTPVTNSFGFDTTITATSSY